MESFYTLFGRAHELNEELKTQVGIEHADISSKSTGLSADTFDLLITDSDLKSKVKKLFLDGHHARAVEEPSVATIKAAKYDRVFFDEKGIFTKGSCVKAQ